MAPLALALKELKAILTPLANERPPAAREKAPKAVNDLLGLFAGLASRPPLATLPLGERDGDHGNDESNGFSEETPFNKPLATLPPGEPRGENGDNENHGEEKNLEENPLDNEAWEREASAGAALATLPPEKHNGESEDSEASSEENLCNEEASDSALAPSTLGNACDGQRRAESELEYENGEAKEARETWRKTLATAYSSFFFRRPQGKDKALYANKVRSIWVLAA